MIKKLLFLFLAVIPTPTKTDLWDWISNNPGKITVAGITLLGATTLAYNSNDIAHAAGDNVQQRAEQIANRLGEVITQEVLPETAGELRSLLRSSLLGCCWVAAAFFGAKLAYDGITDFEKISADKSKVNSPQTLKIIVGAACFTLAIYAISAHFKQQTIDSI